MPIKFDRALSRHFLQEGGIELLPEESLNDAAAVACAECFENEGLRLDAAAIGREHSSVCPRCGAIGGTKLTKRSLAGLARSFFVQESLHRTKFGAAPLITFNDKRPTEWPSGDAAPQGGVGHPSANSVTRKQSRAAMGSARTFLQRPLTSAKCANAVDLAAGFIFDRLVDKAHGINVF